MSYSRVAGSNALGQNGSNGHADQLLLLPPVRDIVAKGQELENGVQYGDNEGGDQQDRIGLQKHALDFVHLAASALGGSFLKGRVQAAEDLELHLRDGLEVDPQGQRAKRTLDRTLIKDTPTSLIR
jgi:hypothetical protein